MRASHRQSAERVRAALEGGRHERSRFRAALLDAPPSERDAWLDVVLGLDELPDDGPELPKGCVPYLPCPVDDLLQIVEHAPVRASDVFVDVGSGVGRAATFVHLLTGASAIGLEVQPRLVRAARDLTARLLVSRVTSIEGDAAELSGRVAIGTIFFLYCPFGGERLAKWLTAIEPIARTRTVRVCCVDLPLPPCDWLALEASPRAGLQIHRSTHGERSARTTCTSDQACYAAPALDPDRIEKLVVQVLEETRAFRQEFNEKLVDFRQEVDARFAQVDARFAQVDARFAQVDARFAEVDEKLGELRRDLVLVQAAVLETASGLREVAKDVKRVETKLDDQGARIDKLEGAAE